MDLFVNGAEIADGLGLGEAEFAVFLDLLVQFGVVCLVLAAGEELVFDEEFVEVG